MKHTVAAASVIAVAALFAAPYAAACSCMRAESHEAKVRSDYAQSAAVFSAYVHSLGELGEDRRRTVRLRVLQVWKGELQPATWVDAISSENGGADCGYTAHPDTALIVYAGGEPPYPLRLCTLSGPLAEATADIPLLNELAGVRARDD